MIIALYRSRPFSVSIAACKIFIKNYCVGQAAIITIVERPEEMAQERGKRMELAEIQTRLIEVKNALVAKGIPSPNVWMPIEPLEVSIYASWYAGSEHRYLHGDSMDTIEGAFSSMWEKIEEMPSATERAVKDAIDAAAKAVEGLERVGLTLESPPIGLIAFAEALRNAVQAYTGHQLPKPAGRSFEEEVGF